MTGRTSPSAHESRGLNSAYPWWHSRTGGTGAHSIRSATTLPLKLRSVYHFNVRGELQ